MTCPNCGASLEGAFCATCGQGGPAQSLAARSPAAVGAAYVVLVLAALLAIVYPLVIFGGTSQ
jgi:hypothetical protein